MCTPTCNFAFLFILWDKVPEEELAGSGVVSAEQGSTVVARDGAIKNLIILVFGLREA